MPPGDFDDLVIVLASDLNGDPPFDALIQEFDCGDQDLNAFLAEEALPYQTHGLTFTYLVFDRELSAANLLGFYSLSSDSLKLEGVECSGLMKPDTHLGENARHIEVSDDQATSCLFR